MDIERMNGGPSVPGGPGGPGGRAIDLTGLLALEKYVFTPGQATSASCYGIYDSKAAAPIAFAPVTAQCPGLKVYLNRECTRPATGVEAHISGGQFTLTGGEKQRNALYYVVPAGWEKPYPTPLYLVNEPYEGQAATLTLADNTRLQLTTYAPNMAHGNYDARPGLNAIEGDSSVFLGGNRTAVGLMEIGRAHV